MIFVQPLYYNFLTTFSLILTLYSYSLSSFFLSLSLSIVLDQWEERKWKLSSKLSRFVVHIYFFQIPLPKHYNYQWSSISWTWLTSTKTKDLKVNITTMVGQVLFEDNMQIFLCVSEIWCKQGVAALRSIQMLLHLGAQVNYNLLIQLHIVGKHCFNWTMLFCFS